MMLLLNPRLWIALALAAVLGVTHMAVYRGGKSVVRAQWEQDKAARAAQALAAEQAARAREQQLVAERKKLEDRYVQSKRKADASAASARGELDRLRDELSTFRDPAAADSAPAGRADGRAGLESQLLGHCATTLIGLAQEADRLGALVVGLQDYVKNVCQKPINP